MLSPVLINFITLLLLYTLHWLKINDRIKYKVLYLTYINLLKLVNLLTSAFFFHSLHIVVFGLLLFPPLVALLVFSHLSSSDNKQILLPFSSCFWNSFPSDIRHVAHLWISIHLFVQLFRHYNSPIFRTVIRVHLISLSCHILVFCHLILFLWSKC